MLTSFAHFVPRMQSMGIASFYFRIGFKTRVLALLSAVPKDIPASFEGASAATSGKPCLYWSTLPPTSVCSFFGYGASSLKRMSPKRATHHGEVWGLRMSCALVRSRVMLNRHINVAENNATKRDCTKPLEWGLC